MCGSNSNNINGYLSHLLAAYLSTARKYDVSNMPARANNIFGDMQGARHVFSTNTQKNNSIGSIMYVVGITGFWY